jgi:hypothetical protein
VITPLALATGSKAGNLTTEAYKRKQELGSVDEAGLFGAILDGRRKTGVILGERWYQAKSESYAAARMLADAVTRGEPPNNVKEQLLHFESIKIDMDSIRVISRGNQKRVFFQLTAMTDNDDPTKKVRLGVGVWNENLVKEPQIGDELDLEPMVLEAIKADRRKPDPTTGPPPPPPTKPVPVQISEDTKALFSTEPTAVLDALTSG